MQRIVSLVFLTVLVAVLISCGGAETQSTIVSNANATEDTNANGALKPLDPANLPPGLSASPVPIDPNANIPGIPKDANIDPKKLGPVPGIPANAELRKVSNSNSARAPGIPSDAEIKRAMQPNNSAVNAPPAANAPMMRMVRKTPKP